MTWLCKLMAAERSTLPARHLHAVTPLRLILSPSGQRDPLGQHLHQQCEADSSCVMSSDHVAGPAAHPPDEVQDCQGQYQHQQCKAAC